MYHQVKEGKGGWVGERGRGGRYTKQTVNFDNTTGEQLMVYTCTYTNYLYCPVKRGGYTMVCRHPLKREMRVNFSRFRLKFNCVEI